jgi:hypothetical protein
LAHWTAVGRFACGNRRSAHLLPGPVRDLLDAENQWRQVAAAVVDAGVAADDVQAAGRLAPNLDALAAQLVDALTLFGVLPGADTLRQRVSGVVPS